MLPSTVWRARNQVMGFVSIALMMSRTVVLDSDLIVS